MKEKTETRKHASAAVETAYGRIHLRQSGEGRPLLMAHGLFASGSTFDDLLDQLPPGVHGVAIDHPGCTVSRAAPSFTPSWHGFAANLVAVADALGFERFDLLGHSMGGGIAIAVAAGWPERVERLVLCDSVCFPFKLPLKGRIALWPLIGGLIFRVYGEKMFADYFRNEVFLDGSKLDPGKLKGLYRVFDNNRMGNHAALKATADPTPVAEDVKDIRAETLVLWGAEDALIPKAMGERLAQSIPGAVLQLVADCGHSPFEEQPELAISALCAFLERKA